jgi:hypothetical protein
VVIAGQVHGGGQFRSRVVTTDASGAFTLLSLASADQLDLTVVPPSDSLAALTTLQVQVNAGPPAPPLRVDCAARVRVSGLVTTSEGLPVSEGQVRASEHLGPHTAPRPVPLEVVIAPVGPGGRFGLRLDQGAWRLDISSPGQPLASRLVIVEATVDLLGNPVLDQPLSSEVLIPSGRTISGEVVGTRARRPGTPIPWATLRFFQVGPVDGVITAILLGTTVTDDRGRYSVVLPTR